MKSSREAGLRVVGKDYRKSGNVVVTSGKSERLSAYQMYAHKIRVTNQVKKF